MKNSLRCRLNGNGNWLSELPWVVLGLRNHPNTDTGIAPSELVFGAKLRVPGHPPTAISHVAPSTFVEKLRTAVSAASHQARETPWHCTEEQHHSNVPANLFSSKRVLVKEERKLASLRPKFSGPYEVVSRQEKYFTLRFPEGGEEKVSIDRIKQFNE
ncbi:Hypothetical predicted protein [Paramuricea clavata]|uniref:Uncharacterized protein n=1 Tax=Paramuricea clavata TaxID=317549 RepID=A0A6S7KJY5_PARCT|nr:Hypothetical predicted protein [Paramuricea clavata]